MTSIGVIGCGSWGRNYIDKLIALKHDVHVYDKSWERMGKLPEVAIRSSMDEMKVLCPIVFVMTPSDTHFEMVRGLLESDIHVLCAKPIALSHKRAGELVRLAKRKNLVLNCGYVYRYSDAAVELGSLLSKTGTKDLDMVFYNRKPPRNDSNIIWNLGIHYLDMIVNSDTILKSLRCKFSDMVGRIWLESSNFSANIVLATKVRKNKRDANLFFGDYSNNYLNFDRSKNDLVESHIRDMVDRVIHGASKGLRDDMGAIRLCELCEKSNALRRKIDI